MGKGWLNKSPSERRITMTRDDFETEEQWEAYQKYMLEHWGKVWNEARQKFVNICGEE